MINVLRALFMLALRALVLQPLSRLRGKQHGRLLFLESYAPEGLVPYSPSERAALPRFSGCVNCGLCDAVCPIMGMGRAPLRDWRGPSLFALAYSRATPGLPALRAQVKLLDLCGTCTLCQAACPRGVPLLEIFAFTKRKLLEVDAAMPPALPPAAQLRPVEPLPVEPAKRGAPA